jgi:hypothetical protein
VQKPEALPVVDQQLHRRGRPVAEHEHPTAKRIVLEHFLANAGQAVDPLAEVGRLDGHHDPHLRRDLDHGVGFQKLRLSAARSGIGTPFSSTRIFAPAAFCHSTVQWQGPADAAANSWTADGANSRKAGSDWGVSALRRTDRRRRDDRP